MDAVTGLLDISKNFSVISTFDIVKVSGTKNKTTAEAMDGDCGIATLFTANPNGGSCNPGQELSNIFCYGELHEAIPDIDENIGLRNLSLLNKFGTLFIDSVYTLIKDDYGRAIKSETEGATGKFRLVSETLVNDQVNVPKFKGAPADVKISPNEKAIKLFRYWKNQATKTKRNSFWAHMNARGKLYFSFDEKELHNETERFEFGTGLPFVKLAPFSYPANHVAKVLELASTSKSLTMSISNKGCLTIDVDSRLGSYQFIFVGDEKLIRQWNIADEWLEPYDLETIIREDHMMHHEWEPSLD